MSTSESESVCDRTTSDPALSLAERINAILLATDGPIQVPIFYTGRKLLERLDLEPTLEQRELVTRALPHLKKMGWQCERPTAIMEGGEVLIKFQRRHRATDGASRCGPDRRSAAASHPCIGIACPNACRSDPGAPGCADTRQGWH